VVITSRFEEKKIKPVEEKVMKASDEDEEEDEEDPFDKREKVGK